MTYLHPASSSSLPVSPLLLFISLQILNLKKHPQVIPLATFLTFSLHSSFRRPIPFHTYPIHHTTHEASAAMLKNILKCIDAAFKAVSHDCRLPSVERLEKAIKSSTTTPATTKPPTVSPSLRKLERRHPGPYEPIEHQRLGPWT